MTYDYNEYSMEKLRDWIYNAIDQNEISAEEIYQCFRDVVVETHEYNKKTYEKSSKLMKLLNAPSETVFSCDSNDTSEKCKNAWSDFWEETYYPEEHKKSKKPSVEDIMPPWGHSDMEALRYTEEELNAMCDAVAEQEERDKCREYNLREAEYYNQRAKLDAELEAIKAAGGFEWTPDPQVSRNDPTRLKYESGWVYESPDGGKTVTKRRPGSLEKTTVKADGYSTSEDSKKWVLPVEQSYIDGTHDYYVNFPDDLLEKTNLKEGDTIEWKDQEDGSYLLSKVEDAMEFVIPYEEDIFEGTPESLLIIPDDLKDILGSSSGYLKWVFNKNGTFTVSKIGE